MVAHKDAANAPTLTGKGDLWGEQLAEIPADVRDRCRSYVASKANDADDARLLMDMLGVLP